MDPTPINISAFRPYDGGNGIILAADNTTGGTAYQIPGLAGGTDGNERKRVLIANGGAISGFIRMGAHGVTTAAGKMEILPGCAYLLTPPDVNPSGVWIAVDAASDGTTISAVAGEGT